MSVVATLGRFTGRPVELAGVSLRQGKAQLSGVALQWIQQIPRALLEAKSFSVSVEATSIISSRALTPALLSGEVTDAFLDTHNLVRTKIGDSDLIITKREAEKVELLYIVHNGEIVPANLSKPIPPSATKAVYCKAVNGQVVEALVSYLVEGKLVVTANLPVGRYTRGDGESVREAQLASDLGKALLAQGKSENDVVKIIEELEAYNFAAQGGSQSDRGKYETVTDLILRSEDKLRALVAEEGKGREVVVFSHQYEFINMWLLSNPQKALDLIKPENKQKRDVITYASRYAQFEIGTYHHAGGMLVLMIDRMMNCVRKSCPNGASAFVEVRDRLFRDFDSILDAIGTANLPKQYSSYLRSATKQLGEQIAYLDSEMKKGDSEHVYLSGNVLVVNHSVREISSRAIYEFLSTYPKEVHLALSHDESLKGMPFSYQVGVNPNSRYGDSFDCRPLWMILGALENEKRARAKESPLAARENWGGHESAGGSPWHITSHLTVNDIVSSIGRIPNAQELRRSAPTFRAKSHTLGVEDYIIDHLPKLVLEKLDQGKKVELELHHGSEEDAQRYLGTLQGKKLNRFSDMGGAKQQWYFEEQADGSLKVIVTNILGYTKLHHLMLYCLYAGMTVGNLHDYNVNYQAQADDLVQRLRDAAAKKGHTGFASTMAIGPVESMKRTILTLLTAENILSELQEGTDQRGAALLRQKFSKFTSVLAAQVAQRAKDYNYADFKEKVQGHQGEKKINPLVVFKQKVSKKLTFLITNGIISEEDAAQIDRMDEESFISFLSTIQQRLREKASEIAQAQLANISIAEQFGIIYQADLIRVFGKDQAKAIWKELKDKGYVDNSGIIQPAFFSDFEFDAKVADSDRVLGYMQKYVHKRTDLERALELDPSDLQNHPELRFALIAFKDVMQKTGENVPLIKAKDVTPTVMVTAKNGIFKGQLMVLPNGESVMLVNISMAFGDLSGYVTKAAVEQPEIEHVVFLGNTGILSTAGANFGIGTSVFPSEQITGEQGSLEKAPLFNSAYARALRDGPVLDLSREVKGKSATRVRTCHATSVMSLLDEHQSFVDDLTGSGGHSVELEIGPILQGLQESTVRFSTRLYASDFPGEGEQTYADADLGSATIVRAVEKQAIYLLKELRRPQVRVKQKGHYTPLIPLSKRVSVIEEAVKAGTRVYTVDFALERYYEALSLDQAQVGALQRDNIDHHDGKNPGKCSTELALARVAEQPNDFKDPDSYLVVSDSIVDHDNILATFTLLNPESALAHRDEIAQAARYGDYPGTAVSKEGRRLALIIDAMLNGQNAYGIPMRKLDRDQKGRLFNEILRDIGLILENPSEGDCLHHYSKRRLAKQRVMLEQDGVLTRVFSKVDLISKSGINVNLLYDVSGAEVVVHSRDIGEGKYHYPTVGRNERLCQADLSLLWERLRTLENQKRESAGLSALDAKDNWGGREETGGSSKDKDIGSLISPEELAREIENYLSQGGE